MSLIEEFRNEKNVSKPLLPNGVSIDIEERFSDGNDHKTFAECYPGIEKNASFHVPSYGTWSTHHVFNHLLSLTGPAHVAICSWAIAEAPMKAIIDAKDKGLLLSTKILLDARVKQYAPNGWQLAQANFPDTYLGKCHAKLLLISNDKYHIVVNGSANWTTNRRLEYYSISENKTLWQETHNWLNEYLSNEFE